MLFSSLLLSFSHLFDTFMINSFIASTNLLILKSVECNEKRLSWLLRLVYINCVPLSIPRGINLFKCVLPMLPVF